MAGSIEREGGKEGCRAEERGIARDRWDGKDLKRDSTDGEVTLKMEYYERIKRENELKRDEEGVKEWEAAKKTWLARNLSARGEVDEFNWRQ